MYLARTLTPEGSTIVPDLTLDWWEVLGIWSFTAAVFAVIWHLVVAYYPEEDSAPLECLDSASEADNNQPLERTIA